MLKLRLSTFAVRFFSLFCLKFIYDQISTNNTFTLFYHVMG